METHEYQIHWSPRVPKWKLRRLYEQASLGIYDDELVDDVGLTLYLRCRDILLIHRAHEERLVTCPRCLRGGTTTLISRAEIRDTAMICPTCGWQSTWLDYRKSFHRRQLNPGGAVAFFQEFMSSYDRANSAKARMQAIDRVIHQFHYSLREAPDLPTRPASVNLIEGRMTDIVRFLDELSGINLPEEFQQMHEEWQRNYRLIPWLDAYDPLA